MTNAGFSTATCNYINTQSQDSQAVDMRREIVVRISRQKDAEPIAAVLGRNGVRHGVQFVWSHSSAEAVREELALEATAAAVAKAQKLAALAGGKAGMILDLTNSQVGIPASAPKDMIVQGGVMNALPISSPVVDELIEEANGLVLVLRVSAIATLQSKSD